MSEADKNWVISAEDVGAYRSLSHNITKKAQLPLEFGDKALNRHGDIMPCPRTRVTLQQQGDSTVSTYINANFIRGPKPGDSRRYIASMGPKDTTADAHWRMVWENDIYAMVMTTNTLEGGKNKCEVYWPQQPGPDRAMSFPSGITIMCKSRKTCEGYERNVLELTRGDDTRECIHYWYNTWPDHGVPKKDGSVYTDDVLHMLKDVNDAVGVVKSDAPVLVHCSAGVGRTGTFIAIDHAQQLLQSESKIDLIQLIKELREDRVAMVQTPQQYQFVYQACLRYAQLHDVSVSVQRKGSGGLVSAVAMDSVTKHDLDERIVPMHPIDGFTFADLGKEVTVKKFGGSLAFCGSSVPTR
jgi:receptor-type tyrosine-protein phosphatase R